MPCNVSIKNVPDGVLRKLRKRAAGNHRSLQGELMSIITAAVQRQPTMTLAEFIDRKRWRGLATPSEAAAIVRADRDSH